MANHQSLFDIPALLASLPGETKFLAKSSLFRIPIFGWALSAGGFVPIDRSDRSTARESFAAAIAALARGVSVLIFPEEARSLDGRVLPFQRGGFLLALKSGLPIVPVGIEGAFEVQPRRSFLIRPGRCAYATDGRSRWRGGGLQPARAHRARRGARVAGAGARRAFHDRYAARGRGEKGILSMTGKLEDAVWEALRTVRFPGMSRDIVSFGFVKGVAVDGGASG